jgi:hypothetical protein
LRRHPDSVTGAAIYDHLPFDYLMLHAAAMGETLLSEPTSVSGLRRFYYTYTEADRFDPRVCGLGRKSASTWWALRLLANGQPVPLRLAPTWYPDLGLLHYGSDGQHRVLGLWGGGRIVPHTRPGPRTTRTVLSRDRNSAAGGARSQASGSAGLPFGWRVAISAYLGADLVGDGKSPPKP